MNKGSVLRASPRRVRIRILAVGLAVLALLALGATTSAFASQNPANCNEHDFILQLKQDPGPIFTVGQTINYSVRAGNEVGAAGCDISGVTITLTTPDGVVHTQQTNGSYPFTTATAQVGALVPYVVDLNDAVAGPCGNIQQCPVIIASAKATGQLHDDPIQDDPFTVIKQVSGPVSPPVQSHFLCYELKRTPPKLGTVSVVDQFGSNSVDADQMHHLCNPTDKRDEDPTAPNRPDHLTGYDADSVGNPAKDHVVSVTNQFGTRQFTLKQVQYVFLRASKSLTGPPAPLANPQVDNFICYSVKDSPFPTIRNVKVRDQFGTLHVDLLEIRQFCDPANIAGTTPGAQNDTNHLTCYRTDLSAGTNFTPPPNVWVTNQFETKKITLDGHVNMLCVPSTKRVVS